MSDVRAALAVALAWPLMLERSHFETLVAERRKPDGSLWSGGDTTENGHSEGAVQAAARMAQETVARTVTRLAPGASPGGSRR